MSEQLFHVATKAVIKNDKGKILILSTHKDRKITESELWAWDLPGGRVEQGNDLIGTLEQELKEETGYKGKVEAKFAGHCIANKKIPSEVGEIKLLLLLYDVKIDKNYVISVSNEHNRHEWCNKITAVERLKQKYPEKLLTKVL